mgnify:CR=1 FL=1
MEVVDNPVSSPDLSATILEGLGIDSTASNAMGDRPIPLVEEGGHAIEDLLT